MERKLARYLHTAFLSLSTSILYVQTSGWRLIGHNAYSEQGFMLEDYMQAGVDGQQNLPDSFQVARATGSEAPQSVYINRELDLDVWQLADKVIELCHFLFVCLAVTAPRTVCCASHIQTGDYTAPHSMSWPTSCIVHLFT